MLRKLSVWFLLSALSILIMACSPSTPAPVVDEPEDIIEFEPTAVVEEAAPTEIAATSAPASTDVPATDVPAATNVPATEAPAQEADSEEPAEEADAMPDGKPIEGATFPAEDVPTAYVWRENDHYKGTTDPDVLIIEYGDFQ